MTGFTDLDGTPIEKAALRLNTLHHHLDMPRRRREARVAAEGLLDVEVIRRVIADHASWEATEVLERLRCSCGADLGEHPMSVPAYDIHQQHQAAALRAALLGEGA